LKMVRHREGKTLLFVPEASLTEDPPPTSPVFFNPAASLNRDITVAVTSATHGSSFCDSMSGVGSRGLRVAKEVERISKVAMNDFNADALKAARRASVMNRVRRKCEFSNSETCSYLFSRSGDDLFDYVDVDPFGSPIRQIQAGLSATDEGGVLSVTATDTAVLCGVHPGTSIRRYGSVPLNNHFHHETGIRILLGRLVTTGASVDLAVEPVAAHSTRHYVRAFSRVRRGASKANSALRGMGHINWCPSCGHTTSTAEPGKACDRCGRRVKVAGPLWTGRLTEPEMVNAAHRAAASMGLDSAATTLGSLDGVDDFPPWSFSIERVCSSLRIATVGEEQVCNHLRETGHRTMRTPFEKTGIKTDGDIADFTSAVMLSKVGA
jgi:tRNA (guanine26-N2/guanine27-N2)-dimethyltransferase